MVDRVWGRKHPRRSHRTNPPPAQLLCRRTLVADTESMIAACCHDLGEGVRHTDHPDNGDTLCKKSCHRLQPGNPDCRGRAVLLGRCCRQALGLPKRATEAALARSRSHCSNSAGHCLMCAAPQYGSCSCLGFSRERPDPGARRLLGDASIGSWEVLYLLSELYRQVRDSI